MPKRQPVLACLASLTLLAGCREAPLETEKPADVEPQFAPGGIPGPPPWVIIPNPPGPPPRVPVPLPPQAGPPSFLEDIVEVGAGADFSCALRSDGLVFCWGANGSGQLGDGSQAPSSVPVEVSGTTRFARLFVGNLNVCGLSAAGEAYCWGNNSQGQVGGGSSNLVQRVPAPVAGGHLFTDLSIGLSTTCGVATDQVTYCWGSNANGVLGTGAAGGSSTVPVAVSNSGALGFTSVTVGFVHACGLDAAGAAYCWGQQSLFGNGTTGFSFTPTPAAGGADGLAALEAGDFYSCAIDEPGDASCWGTINSSGEMGTGSLAVATTPTPVVGDLQFASLDVQNNNSFLATTCGITGTGAAFCWGSNERGQLGAPSSETCTFSTMTYDCSTSPVEVSGGNAYAQLAVGIRHGCAVDTGGTAWCWGANHMGQLGDGTMDDSATPVRVRGLAEPERIGSIVVTPFTPTLRLLGSTQQFMATALDESGSPLATQPEFTWSSSNPSVAPVDATGLATALVNGNTVITAMAPDGASGRAALRVDILDPVLAFQQAWVGGAGSDGVSAHGGLLADEWLHVGTFPTRRQVDVRTITPDNVSVEGVYERLDSARLALEFETARLLGASPSDPRIGHMRTLAGYVYLAFAENFCSGVPLFDPDDGLTTAQLFGLAATRFAEALAGPIASPYGSVATIGTARARLGMGDFAGAAAAAAEIPTPFMFRTAHSANAGEENGIFALNIQGRRISVADGEGTNGLPFRSAADPRVPWADAGIGQGGVLPLYALLKYPDVGSDVPVATGIEARLIEAEAALRVPDVTAMLVRLNELRAIGGLPPLVDPGSVQAGEDLLFRERALWLFATGTRLGDLRRRIAWYGRAAADLFPTGAHASGVAYGTDANLPVPASARGQAFAGCTVRGI